MLVFTRRRDEAVMIGHGIEVKVLRVGRDGVRLGVTAPPEVAVHRQEIYRRVGAANVTAAAGSGDGVGALAERLRRRSAPVGEPPA